MLNLSRIEKCLRWEINDLLQITRKPRIHEMKKQFTTTVKEYQPINDGWGILDVLATVECHGWRKFVVYMFLFVLFVVCLLSFILCYIVLLCAILCNSSQRPRSNVLFSIRGWHSLYVVGLKKTSLKRSQTESYSMEEIFHLW